MDARAKPRRARPARPRPAADVVARGMAQWRSERPDIDSSGKAVVGRLLRLEGLVMDAANSALAPYGLKFQEYGVLATLRVQGAPYCLTPSQLQAALLFTSGGLSNLIKRLEANGWVERTDDPNDGRGVLVSLTAKGRRLADRAMPEHANTERRLLSMFSIAERAQLADLLARMISGAGPDGA